MNRDFTSLKEIADYAIDRLQNISTKISNGITLEEYDKLLSGLSRVNQEISFIEKSIE